MKKGALELRIAADDVGHCSGIVEHESGDLGSTPRPVTANVLGEASTACAAGNFHPKRSRINAVTQLVAALA